MGAAADTDAGVDGATAADGGEATGAGAVRAGADGADG